jgi:lipopolysaccharide assembly outer membrane protein LptD (OstA)
MRRYKFLTILIISITFFILSQIQIFAKESFVLTAENVVYEQEKQKIFAKKDVMLKYKNIIIKTQEAIYDTEKDLVYTTTLTTVYRDKDIINLDGMVYDIKTGSITSKSFDGFFDPYYCYSKDCVITNTQYLLSDTKITHCDLKEPHYYFAGKKVVVYPKDKIEIYSPKMLLWKIPILWLPYYEISLKRRRDCMIIEPGHDSYNGIFAKIKYIYQLTDNTDIRILLDLYQYQGVGTGLEYRYSLPNYSGIFYAYYIKQQRDNKIRWNFLFNDTHKLNSLWYMQTSFEFLSDNEIYYYYYKENWFLLKDELNSSISFVRNSNKTNFRTSYLRKDEYLPLFEKFVNKNYQTPINFIYYPISIGKLSISESFNIVPTFREGTDNYEISTTNNISTAYSFKFLIFAFTPSISFNTYIVKPNVNTDFYYYNVYGFSLPFRYRIKNLGILDVSYNYGIKSLQNSFLVEDSIYSVVNNNLSQRLDIFHKRKYLRSYFEYNFLVQTTDWRKKVSPIITDVGTDFGKTDLNLHTKFNLEKNVLENFQLSLGYKFSLRNRLGITYGNDINFPQIHVIHTSLDLAIKNLWQFRIQTVGNYEKEYDILNAKYELYRSLHCWETKIAYTFRKNVQEIWAYVGFKFNDSFYKLDKLDNQYLPWRNW